jgi:ribonuclease P protein component
MGAQILSAPLLSLSTLKTRRQFLALRSLDQKIISHYFIIQFGDARKQECYIPDIKHQENCYIGYTVTKKIGNAVVRNRIKRRLREIARAHLVSCGKPNYAYNIIARHAIINAPFERIAAEFQRSLRKIHA